jgi:hypothetical protein
VSKRPVILVYNGDEVVATPAEGGWRVRFRDREVTSAYLEYAIAHVLGVGSRPAIAMATQLVEQLLALPETSPRTPSNNAA